MKCKVFLTIASCVLLLPVLVFGQMKKDTQVNMAQALTKPSVDNVVSLLGLDPTRFSMSHSYSFAIGTDGHNSYNMGLYLNTMRYQLAGPLSLHLQLGMQHSPLGKSNEFGPDNSGRVFVSSAGMEYRPSDNFQLQFQFSQRPSSYYYGSYRSPFRGSMFNSRSWVDANDAGGDNSEK